jgi:hypothetical protein
MQVVIIKPDVDLSQEIMQDGTVVRRTVLLTLNQAQLRKAGSVTPMCSVLNLDLAMSAFLTAVDNTSDLDSVCALERTCVVHVCSHETCVPGTGCAVQIPVGLPVASECGRCGHATVSSHAHCVRSHAGRVRDSIE